MSLIAVTGASGFVGRALLRELAAEAHVVPLSRAQLSSQDLVAMLNGVQTFVHLAARAHVLSEDSVDPAAEFWRSNVGLTQHVALAARRAGVKRFVFVSSAGVLGAISPREGFREDSPPHPHDAYTTSKLQAEEWLKRELAPSLDLVIVRPPLIYGAGAKGNLMRLLRLALRGWPLPIGALCAPRSLVGIRNVVSLLCRVSTLRGEVSGTMLVADRETVSVADLFRTIAGYAGHRPWLAPAPPSLIRLLLRVSGRGADVARLTGPFVLHPRVASDRLQWNPPYAQQEELRQMVSCLRESGGSNTGQGI
jgi:nucleoside-diphosphate-sugar epimerase